ncbi:glucose-6-phosphate isomerase [Belnapia sp. T6]|uniref:Glucose-6-phosphate isomerase n=1 Tax=Belnapia mucosa TaxID=2804532 RepID=A0ABS1V5V3_9PROT|nr:glucose-6-phosphate isomerase [Belnapia mucosa]MBL6457055.1 glucose-6-phosphate isomerase [Belnapia mucosa]
MAEGLAAAWAAVEALARQRRPDGSAAGSIRPLFAADPDRFRRFSHAADGLLLDLSKTSLTDAVRAALLDLARAAELPARRDAMARGEAVNVTERRAALHMALRGTNGFRAGEEDASAEVAGVLARMRDFTLAVTEGRLRGATGERFTDVLNIGIGGSDLGPAMVARALWTPGAPLRPHYLGNVDAHAWEEIQPRLDPRRTLVLVASKTFTTQETMTNAALVRAWLAEGVGEAAVGTHLAALSTNLKATEAFGIAADRVFPFRDWVGGRFSLWSAIGLSLALSLGWQSFERLLAGARAMDAHFLAAPLEANLPVLLALTEIWHVNGLGCATRAVLPYDERLARLPAHLQQLEMESLGKRVTLDGAPVAHDTGPVVFGEPGTNAQHSFMQLVHQGTRPVPADIILVKRPDHAHADSHRKLLANGLAQAAALMRGKTEAEVRAEMAASGTAPAEIERLLPHRVFPGDRPTVTLLLPHLDAFTLGQVVALYEHKVASLGILWGINAFDQWGVELGKQLTGPILKALEGGPAEGQDASTLGLLAALRAG